MAEAVKKSEKREKIGYLDGIRGLAAMGVLFTHIVVAFYPAVFNGKAAEAHLEGAADAVLGHSIWAGCFASNLAVPMLFVLSAYVLSFRFFLKRDPAIATANAYRRYLRLVGPVLFSMLLACFFLRCGWFYNVQVGVMAHSEWFLGAQYLFPADFGEAVQQALWKCFSMDGVQTYNPPLWTMNFELLGSFTVFGFLALFGRSPRRYVIYAVMAGLFIRSYYFAFVLGVILSDMRYSDWGGRLREGLRSRSWLCVLLLLVGAFFGTYFTDGQTPWSRWLEPAFLVSWGVNLFAFWHIIGAALLFTGCLYHERLQCLLSWRPLTFLGRIAFSFYLLHFILLCSLGCKLFLLFQNWGWPYFTSVLAMAAALWPVTILASWLMTVYIDEPLTRAVKRLQKRYLY